MKQTTQPIQEQSTLSINVGTKKTSNNYEAIFLEKTGKKFNDFYKEFYPKLLWQIKKISIDDIDADYITTEAFMHSLEKIEMYNPEFAYSTWLFHIAKNIAYQYKKKRSKIVLIDGSTDDNDVDSSSASMNYYVNNLTKVDDILDNEEYEKKVQLKYKLTLKAISSLKDKYRHILELCDIDKKSYLEIVEITGLPMQTVKNRVFHGRSKIIESLKKEFKYINETVDLY